MIHRGCVFWEQVSLSHKHVYKRTIAFMENDTFSHIRVGWWSEPILNALSVK